MGKRFKLIVLSLLLFACSKEEKQINRESFIAKYSGEPFTGSVVGELLVNDELAHQWEGRGTIAVVEPLQDSVSLVFRANFGAEGALNFKVRGKQIDENFLADDGVSTFRILDDKIDGKIKNATQHMSFSGFAQTGSVLMDMEVLFLEAQSGFPKDAVLRLAFRTSRELADGDGKGCKMIMVPISGPYGMTLGMVPDCD